MTLGAHLRPVVLLRLFSRHFIQSVLVASFLLQLYQHNFLPAPLSPIADPSQLRLQQPTYSVLCLQQPASASTTAQPKYVAISASSVKWIPLTLVSSTTIAPKTIPTDTTTKLASSSTISNAVNYLADAYQSVPQVENLLVSLQTQQEHHSTLVNLTQLILDRFGHVFSWSPQPLTSQSSQTNYEHSSQSANETHQMQWPLHPEESKFYSLETRANIPKPASSSDRLSDHSYLAPDILRGQRKFFRVHNRVFSRVELPEPFRRSASRARNTLGVSSGISGIAPALNLASDQCAPHIGCIGDLPNFPTLLRLKLNVSASFTVYTRDGPKGGSRIAFDPIIHHQLQDDQHQQPSELEIQQQFANSLSQQPKLAQMINDLSVKPAVVASSVTGGSMSSRLRRNRNTSGSGHRSRSQHRKRDQGQQQASLASVSSASAQLMTTANTWLSGIRIARSQELPYDLAAMEQTKFNGSQETRIIIGGYFAKEEEEWIDELVRQWQLLEPDGNVIKVSWQDSNRGLYHTAAHNSRIVGRQLSLFLHYLNQIYGIDLDKFHLVGHSLGAHIAGFVGADHDGQIARITGLDPAGPIFIELNASMRLDPSDAKFVDVLHTNGGTITKGALGLSTPLGHVDYYCNGGSLQPGCYFSSVTKSIMDPVERVACNHRRSYRYFTELIRLAIQERQQEGSPLLVSFPRAFLFREPKQESDLARLVHPELSLLRHLQPQLKSLHESFAVDQRLSSDGDAITTGPSLTRRVEFHLMKPERVEYLQSAQKQPKGLYFFRTRSEAPFFGSRQYALTLKLNQHVKRKITLLVKINSTLVTVLELDELSSGDNSFLFVPQDSKLIDHEAIVQRGLQAPDLWLMWRQRSFNLLLSHQSELQVNSIELTLLDSNNLNVFTNGGENLGEFESDQSQQDGVKPSDVESSSREVSHQNDVHESRRKKVMSTKQQQVLTIRYGNNYPHREWRESQMQAAASGSEASDQQVAARPSTTVINVSEQSQEKNNNNIYNNVTSVLRPAASSATTIDRLTMSSSSSSSSLSNYDSKFNVPILLLRNQWHKFSDGKPVIIQTQVVI